ncbi:hypothetical protein J7K93_01615 [bacterium]|nr:hypothetical protein [bacterium]
MKMKDKKEIFVSVIIGWMLIFPVVQLFGIDASQLFKRGNSFYTQGKIDSALVCYQKIVKSGYESGPLYFNIGNCYYKLNDIAHAILNYERTKRFMPRDEALSQNINIARLRVVDKINPMPEFFLVKIVKRVIFAVSVKILTITSIVFYIAASVFLIIIIITRRRSVKKICRYGVVISVIVFSMSALCLFSRIQSEKHSREAVITADEVKVMSAPSAEEGVKIFSIHSGTVIKIESLRGDWAEIVLVDGKVGWMKRGDFEEVWPQ